MRLPVSGLPASEWYGIFGCIVESDDFQTSRWIDEHIVTKKLALPVHRAYQGRDASASVRPYPTRFRSHLRLHRGVRRLSDVALDRRAHRDQEAGVTSTSSVSRP